MSITERTTVIGLVMLAASTAVSTQTPPAADVQVAAAVQAAPEDCRASATVLGYDSAGALVTLRTGTNDLVCLADNPKTEGLSVACYHKDLDPYMARGRALAAQGVPERERDTTRWKEVEAGTLPLPREARTLYALTGKSFDAATGRVADPYLRWVLYVPFATPASTGLGTRSVPGGPWLMDGGTAGAHIMINPAPPNP